MSELTNTRKACAYRRNLFATASLTALISFACAGQDALASDAGDGDHSSLWIELGGQLSRIDAGQEIFSPVFPNSPARPSIFSPSQKFERSPLYSIDETGKLSFTPEDSDWVFSASVQFGRSAGTRHVHQQTYAKSFVTYYVLSGYHITRKGPPAANQFADTRFSSSGSHLIVDFQAGKDVGLGMFGSKGGSSVLDVGVRFAQFSARTNIALKSDPDWKFVFRTGNYPSLGIYNLRFIKSQPYHSNYANLTTQRQFHGVGPSISWNASAPFAGNSKGGELSLDWGLNAAVLFGRQKAKTHHQTTGRYHYGTAYAHPKPFRPITFQGPATPDHTRVRTVIVPNVGGFAGLSFHVENFKVSAGYRADLFFGAMDGGIDTAKKENVGFYGPFASVSIGLGG